MGSQFGENILAHGEQKHLCLQQVVPLLEMDTAQQRIVEKGLLQLKLEQIHNITNILKANEDDVLTLWSTEQLYAVVRDGNLANEAIQVTEEKIKFRKRKKN